jgi:hypothetical protein
MRKTAAFSVLGLLAVFFAAVGQYTPPPPSGSAAVWGNITGTLSSQTDLQTALNAKAASNASTTVNGVTCTLGSTCTVSGSLGSGTYAALPATCTTGYLYLFTDTVYDTAYCSGTNTYTYHEPFVGAVTPVATQSTMTWVNQTSATLDTTYGFGLLSAVNNGGSAHKWKLRVLTIPTPANPYTVTMWFQAANLVGNGQANDRFAVVLYNSSSGKFNELDFNQFTGNGNNYSVAEWTNTTTFSSQPSAGALGTATFASSVQAKYGLQIVVDSSNTTYYFSINGSRWVQLYQEAKNTFVTPDSVGFGFDAFDANLIMQVDSFKLTQP